MIKINFFYQIPLFYLTIISDHYLFTAFAVLKMSHPIIQRIDHLGLVASFCHEIGLVQAIDRIIPKHGEHHVSHGQAVLAMILNGLGFNSRTLHLCSDFYQHKPIEQLIGSGIKAEHLTDDVLGRTLDALFKNDVSSLYQVVAALTVDKLGLKSECVHLDITSFHVDGEYKDNDEDINVIKLVQGYSRDHRPELNQVVLELICESQAGLPIYMKALSGNTNDTKAFTAVTKAHVNSLKAAQNNRYLISDAALFTKESLTNLKANNQLFISRVPMSISLAKKALLELDITSLVDMGEGYSGCWINSNYADVEQRWLVVKSEQAAHRETATFKRKLTKTTQEEVKSFTKLTKKSFACEEDARVALKEFEKSCRLLGFSDIEIAPLPVFKKSGRPSQNIKPVSYKYQIVANTFSNLEKVKIAKSKIGMFILATNDLNEKRLDMKSILANYKSQQKVEGGFRFLKSPDFLTSSIFLKKPERIEALLMIMTLSLLVYAGLEFKIRQQLAKNPEFFPSMVKNKTTARPTARWVFYKFEGINLWEYKGERLISGLQEYQLRLLDLLGERYSSVYS